MPWVEPIFNEAKLVTCFKCCIYSQIEKKDKVLVAKWNSIDKHASQKKAPNGKWFMDPKCGHLKNEIVYVQLSTIIIFQQFNLGQAMEDKGKIVQFATIFILLNKGKPMTNYQDSQPLIKFLKL